MEPQAYQAWLAGGVAAGSGNLAQAGEQLFKDLACVTCHLPDGKGRGPSLVGVPGSQVKLADGRTITADDDYLRESIVNSQAKIVAGYQPLMPVFQGMVSEDQVMALIAYVKSLKK
jgi:cytochrome c oxidase subunit 2